MGIILHSDLLQPIPVREPEAQGENMKWPWAKEWPVTFEGEEDAGKEELDKRCDQEAGSSSCGDGDTAGKEDPSRQAGEGSEVKGETGKESEVSGDLKKHETLIHLQGEEMGLKLSTKTDRMELYMPRQEMTASDLMYLRDGIQATEAIINIMLSKMGQLIKSDETTQ